MSTVFARAFSQTFTVNHVLGFYVEFTRVTLNIISVFHKNYEQISTTLILRGTHYNVKVKKGEQK